MSSVLARYEVSGERRKPKPSGSTSSVPSPKIDSPFFAVFFSMAKIRSCLRIRLAPSMPFATAISTSWVTWCCFSSDRCIGMGGGGLGAASCSIGERTTSVSTAWDLLIFGKGAEGVGAENLLPLRLAGKSGSAAQRVSILDVAVKEGGELRLRERPDARRLDVAVLEQHQRRDAADAEFSRHALVLIHVDLGDLQPALVFLGDLVEDRRDGLAGAAPLGPVIHQHRGVRLQDLGVESVVGDMAYVWTAHGSFQGGDAEPPLWGCRRGIPRHMVNY